MGRLVLALVAGHIYALASFEVSRLWAFSPFPFRPLEALCLVLACGFVLGAHQTSEQRRYRLLPFFFAWTAVVGIPLNLPPIVTFLGVSLLATVLILTSGPLRESGLLLGLALALAGAGFHYECQGWLAVFLTLGACFEVLGPGLPPPRPWVDAVLEWHGFEQLVEDSKGNQGEEFREKVLADSHNVMVACGAIRLESHERGGTYRFEELEALEVARFHLKDYGKRVSLSLADAEHEPLMVSLEQCT